MDLLGGTKRRVVLNQVEEKREEGERKEEEIEGMIKEELIRQWKKLKMKMAKAPGEVGIENEAKEIHVEVRYNRSQRGTLENNQEGLKNIWRTFGEREEELQKIGMKRIKQERERKKETDAGELIQKIKEDYIRFHVVGL